MSVSVEYLHQRLWYNSETGKLYWRSHPPHGPSWNTRWAGREAFAAVHSGGYRQGYIDSVPYLAHVVIWAMHHGYWPLEVDHEDHDRANNRIGNLRDVSHADNGRNARRSRANTSGVTGVHWVTRQQRWVAKIMVNRRTIHLGTFATFDAAVATREAAERDYNFHPNHGAAA